MYGEQTSTGTDTIAFDRLRVQNAPDNPHDYILRLGNRNKPRVFKYTASVEQQRKQSCFGILATYNNNGNRKHYWKWIYCNKWKCLKLKIIDFLKGII